MQTHNLKRTHKNKKDRIVGRGGKHAKTSGRGGKGQTARAGNKRRPELRDIIKKLPKQRGYRFNSFEIKPVPVSLDKLILAFPKGGEINPAKMIEGGFLKKKKGIVPQVKILAGKNKLAVAFSISKCSVSEEARKSIVEAGGEVK